MDQLLYIFMNELLGEAEHCISLDNSNSTCVLHTVYIRLIFETILIGKLPKPGFKPMNLLMHTIEQ